ITTAPNIVERPRRPGNHQGADVSPCVVESCTCLRFRIIGLELLQWITPCSTINETAVVAPACAIPVRKGGQVDWFAASSGTLLVEMPGTEERDPLPVRRKKRPMPPFGMLYPSPLAIGVRADPKRLAFARFTRDDNASSIRR